MFEPSKNGLDPSLACSGLDKTLSRRAGLGMKQASGSTLWRPLIVRQSMKVTRVFVYVPKTDKPMFFHVRRFQCLGIKKIYAFLFLVVFFP